MKDSLPSIRKKHKNTPTIGLVGLEFTFDNQIYVFRGVKETARLHNINMIYIAGEVIRSSHDYVIQANILYDLINNQFYDGLIFISSLIGAFYITPEELKTLYETYHPVPVISMGMALDGFPSIIIDNTEGMYTAVSHLIEVHGYKRIAYISGPEDHPDAQQRYHAYIRAMKDHDLSINPDLILPGDFRHETGAYAISILMDKRGLKPGRDIDALVAANDFMAFGAIMELQARGFKIPGDIAVTGFDDILLGQYFFPTLSTVQQPFYKMGKQAAELLISCFKGEHIPDVIKLPTVFIPRESCGCNDKTGSITNHVNQLPEEVKKTACTRPREFLHDLSHKIFIANMPEHNLKSWAPLLTKLNQPEKWELAVSGEKKKSPGEKAWSLIGTTACTFFQMYWESKNLRNLGTDLTSTLEIHQLMNKLAGKLPGFDIRCCYIVLYEKPPKFIHPQKIPRYSRLILAYEKSGRIQLPPEGLRFLSHNLLPPDILKNREYSHLVIEALYFRETQIGFYLMDAYAMDEVIYQVLREQISCSLHSALLLTRIRAQTRELAIAHKKIQSLNEQLKKENFRMSTEISVARQLQLTLLPDKVRTIHPDFEISAGIVSTPGVAGDYYDINLDCNGSLWLGIGDVSGKGLIPGLILMIVKTIHTTLITHYQVSALDIITIVNQVLYKNIYQHMGNNCFMSMTQLKYIGKGRFQFAGLHQDILIYRKNSGTYRNIGTSGMWLNLMPDIRKFSKNDEFTIDIGDILILFTNGLTDVMNRNKKLLDLYGLKKIITSYAEKDVEDMKDAILKDVNAWCNKRPEDDISLILARRIH